MIHVPDWPAPPQSTQRIHLIFTSFNAIMDWLLNAKYHRAFPNSFQAFSSFHAEVWFFTSMTKIRGDVHWPRGWSFFGTGSCSSFALALASNNCSFLYPNTNLNFYKDHFYIKTKIFDAFGFNSSSYNITLLNPFRTPSNGKIPIPHSGISIPMKDNSGQWYLAMSIFAL